MDIKRLIISLADNVPFKWRTRIKNIPGLKQLQAGLLKKWVDHQAFTATISGGPAKGLVFPVQMPQDKLMWIGTWELDFAEELKGMIRPGWICYDIGGYKGYYAGMMALNGAAEVYVFEPMPGNAEKIKELVALNPMLPIKLREVAVSGTTGKVAFNIMPENTMGKLSESSFQKDEKMLSELTVSSVTIDELVSNEIPAPDFMKIDVEGAEEFVLTGALKTLANKRPAMMIEIHSQEIGQRCVEILRDFYKTIIVFETGLPPGSGEEEICHYIVE